MRRDKREAGPSSSNGDQGMPRMDHLEPEAERIALLLEGRLTGKDRARLVSTLAHAEEGTLDAFADAAALVSELESASATKSPRFSPWRRHPALMAVAAALILAAPIALLARRMSTMSATPDPSAFAFGLSSAERARHVAWPVTRGAPGSVDESAQAARMGFLITDLQVAARARDTAARGYALALAELADDRPGGAAAAAVLRRIAAASPIDSSLPSRIAVATRGAAALSDARRVALGAWVEAARAAAASHDLRFFQLPIGRQGVDLLSHSSNSSAARRVKDGIERLDRTTLVEWNALQSDLDALARELAG
jgi:hypothetical protein